MPGELKKALSADFAKNKETALGYVKLFFGNRESVSDGIRKVFSYQGPINPESIKIKPDGSILYENAFGKNNYDLQISKDKVGVDGPFTNNMKKTGLSLDSIGNAKRFIIEGPVSKTIEQATMEMGKEGTDGKGVEAGVYETKGKNIDEKSVPIIDKKTGGRKGNIIDISTEPEPRNVEMDKGKMIDLSERSSDKEFDKATAENIKNIETSVSDADKKHFEALVSKFGKYSDNDFVKAIESAKNEDEKKLIAKAIAKVMEMRNLQSEKDF